MQYLCHTNKAPGRHAALPPCAQHGMAAVPGACPAMLAPCLCPCPPSHSRHVYPPRSLILSATGGLPRGRSVDAAVPWCQPAMPVGNAQKRKTSRPARYRHWSLSPPDVRAIAWHVEVRLETGVDVPLNADQEAWTIAGIAGASLMLSTPPGPLHIGSRWVRRLTMLGPGR